MTERYSYDVFGQPSIYIPSHEPRATSDVNNPYMFTGRRYDPETGLYYYRARYYSPEIGRFLQTDPLGTVPDGGEKNPFYALARYEDGLNLYSYVGNNPINLSDPDGLYSWEGKGTMTEVSKGFCKAIKHIPYFGSYGARSLEGGWCTSMAQKCRLWCGTSDAVCESERSSCDEKCAREHTRCFRRAMGKKCTFKFKISG